MSIYYIDGEFIDADKAVLSFNDMAVLRGYGIFDFLRTYNGRPFYLEEHLERFINSGRHVGLEVQQSLSELTEIVMETLARNNFRESNIRIVLTGGISPDSITPQGNGRLAVMVTEKLDLPGWWYTDGAAVVSADVERYVPEAKSTNYMNAVLTQQKAKKQGAIESIYVDRNGRVLEGTTTNIFLFMDGKWITPGQDILPGITRSVIMDLMKGEYEVDVRDITREDILRAEEILITASNKEVVPVRQFDDKIIGDGTVGPETRKVMEMFAAFTDEYGKGIAGKKAV
ncbi:MAG: aminotransferase class IV [Spirochaetales bacterium]|nr:aminotransferase class IV [Spirochaetales bacterium]